MSKYIKSTTETIIQTLIDGGYHIEYFPFSGGLPGHTMGLSVNGEQCMVSGGSFEELNENFISHYVGLATENSERIDGACLDVWHQCRVQYDDCPTCGEKSDQWHHEKT